MNIKKVIFVFLFILFFYGYCVYENKKLHLPPCNVIYIHHNKSMTNSPYPDGSNFDKLDKYKIDK